MAHAWKQLAIEEKIDWFHRELGPYTFPLVVLHRKPKLSFYLWCMLGGSVWIVWSATYHNLLRVKLILAPLGIPKWVWPSMNRFRKFFIWTSTLPSSIHRQLTKHRWCCMQNNQLPTKSHVELKDYISFLQELDCLFWKHKIPYLPAICFVSLWLYIRPAYTCNVYWVGENN